MHTRRVVELAVGLGLMLGPLVYALTLEQPAGPDRCVAATVVAEPAACVAEPVQAGPEPRPESDADPGRREAFLFVTDAGIVLSDAAERSWGQGRLFEPPGQVSYRAAKRADVAALPSELWQLAGRTYDLYGSEGKLCTARLGELRVVAQYGGWGVGGLLGDEWYEEDPDQASAAQIRRALWARDDLWLVAEIAADGPCEGALWARDAALPPPSVLRRTDAPNPTTAARLAAFAESPELAEAKQLYQEGYAELAANYPEALADYDDWDTLVREHGATAWSWIDGRGQVGLVGLEFGHEQAGCGDWPYAWLTALDRVGPAGGPDFEPVEHPHDPVAVFDGDGDGRLELLYVHDDSRRLVSASLEAELSVDQDWLCPC